MKQIIAVINQKGGVGKSTTVASLGAGLIGRGERVLMIDLDAQRNLSDTLCAHAEENTLLDLLAKRQTGTKLASSVKACIRITAIGDCIPAAAANAGADLTVTGVGKEMRLREALTSLYEEYDYILIDTPPTLGILSVNALTAATHALIPAQADPYSLQGIGQLYDTLDAVRTYTNPDLQLLGIVLTRYNAHAVLNREVAQKISEAANQIGTRLCGTKIRECIALREAQASRSDIFRYAPASNAAHDYKNLVEELFG